MAGASDCRRRALLCIGAVNAGLELAGADLGKARARIATAEPLEVEAKTALDSVRRLLESAARQAERGVLELELALGEHVADDDPPEAA